ncbi:hypothetical protein AC579_3012 [Pseudocercospora musae]|uniref:Uncharacterized protein n=1 Tax=Pseudocercospora musae TaxID=113226 RepID=A0A139I4U6_9PEZI|nr:hypothetical protein AC579_3012 [Pseudocercospora musae]KXT09650.1 hypothetical protein AC579_3012 [Pseudocercospora musae]KXT09654.1 hypothetical protein AC579_3012 [Pseudocercospora musae]KXT09658.1 hypothetical protein AC579_3012 [Pseudocercospora musae]
MASSEKRKSFASNLLTRFCEIKILSEFQILSEVKILSLLYLPIHAVTQTKHHDYTNPTSEL